jgi:hypothetical protein
MVIEVSLPFRTEPANSVGGELAYGFRSGGENDPQRERQRKPQETRTSR